MIDQIAMKEKFDPYTKTKNYIQYKIQFRNEHPNYFYPDGLLCFVGPQGSGKTLSAVNYVYNLLKLYPKAKIVTNIQLRDYPIVTFEEFLQTDECSDYLQTLSNVQISLAEREKLLFKYYMMCNRVFPFNNSEDLTRYSNGEYGVIFLIDEIQLYFNSLESKNINPDVMLQISQQRKQRKHIVCTSQVFGRMAKPLREQFSSVVLCHSYFGFLQKNQWLDRDSVEDNSDTSTIKGKVKQNFWYIHTPEYYGRYDTYYVIDKNKFVSNEKKVGDIYDNRVQLNVAK